MGRGEIDRFKGKDLKKNQLESMMDWTIPIDDVKVIFKNDEILWLFSVFHNFKLKFSTKTQNVFMYQILDEKHKNIRFVSK